MKNNKKYIVVLGAGESGIGAALLAQKYDMKVFVSDNGPIASHFKDELINAGISFEENGHTESEILKAVEIIKSPGIPESAAIIKKIRISAIPLISEIEFASRYTKANLISVTGSNGKSTTASLIFHLLKTGGKNVALAGNIGKAWSRVLLDTDYEYFVLELSSFQLDDIEKFKSHISVILNITPDHLDRYNNNFNEYTASKFRITLNQDKNDFLIYNYDDQTIKKYIEEHSLISSLMPFSIEAQLEKGAYISKDKMIINTEKSKKIEINMDNLSLKGLHNQANTMAATVAARLLDLRKETIKDSLANFKNMEHRLEFVAKVHGIEFINDSKATNVNAAWYALECMENPIVWIAGGIDKGNDYETLKPLVKEKVKAILILGGGVENIKNAFTTDVDLIMEVKSMNEAVRIAYHLAEKQETVLLSPACASFDLFENFEDRGRKFKECVKNL